MLNCIYIIHFIEIHPNFTWAMAFYSASTKTSWLRDKNVIYVSPRGHWDCTTLQHHCTSFGFTSGYTEVLQGGTISMPTGRHVDNLKCNPNKIYRWKQYYWWKKNLTI